MEEGGGEGEAVAVDVVDVSYQVEASFPARRWTCLLCHPLGDLVVVRWEDFEISRTYLHHWETRHWYRLRNVWDPAAVVVVVQALEEEDDSMNHSEWMSCTKVSGVVEVDDFEEWWDSHSGLEY